MGSPARAFVAVVLGLAAAAARAGEPGPRVPVLDDGTYARLRAHVLPTAEETEWREIPWRPALWEAVREAQERDRPILLWAMNGHPLGCT